ncbi:alpha-fetoprotein-like isoform X2 [Zalophus californianus]|uniref:Alpha-fetoprotein-like isoform X2 n=1 Tax=Zalophus californianus TaxID=9704 RepID=A0A6J2DNZ7_ZALCA|nr:alpha-fetoprotein-like isoform X2 [Zalophus californianus]
MKTLRPICFLVFFSYVQCQTLLRSLLAAALCHINSQNYLQENLRDIASIMVAQFLQKLTYEEVQTVAEELVDVAEKCKILKSHESPSECSHQLMTMFLEHICNNQGKADKQKFSDCCNINNKARLKCFLLYKKDDADYSDIFQIPNPEQICEMDKVNQVSVKERYIYETSRKHPFLYGPTILTMSACYETAIQSCCQEENKTECFQIKSQLMNYTCSEQSILSSKISPCCALPEPFRGECAINSENDDEPDLPSLPLSRFTEDLFVCAQFSNKPDDFLQEFLYEYSRRHSELAVPVVSRVDTVYQNLLAKCCKLENPLECYSHGQEMFQRVVRESREHVKHHCDLHEKLGDANFHDWLIILYTKKAPQLSAQELVMFIKNMGTAATKCCPLRDEQQFACMEDSAKLILGGLRRRHEAEPIDAGVGHCCDASYAFRKPCFDDLQDNGTYISPPLSCDQVINLKENLCKAQEEEFQTEKQKFLSNLVKQKPYATEMQFQSMLADFAHLVKCCQTETSEMCFREDVSLSPCLFS